MVALVVSFAGKLGEPAAAPSGAPSLRVLTLNLGDLRTDPADFVPAIRMWGADLVALQEVGERHVAGIRAGLGDLYPHMALEPRGLPGIGLLSKTPLLDLRLYELASAHPYQSASIELDGRRIRIVNAHPRAWIAFLGRLSPEARDLPQVLRLATQDGPGILLGDFNTTERTWAYRRIVAAGLVDSWTELDGGWGFTFPVFRRWRGVPSPPLVRIDYVFHTAHLRASGIAVGKNLGSDHLPLVCDLGWR